MAFSMPMERAGRLIGKLKTCVAPEDLALAAWPAAVGKRIAAHACAAALVRSCLIVEVEDLVWQKQLNTLRAQILARIAELLGPGVVDDIAFQPATPRRLPQREDRAARPAALANPDEADLIPDPVLRRLYKQSRRKATD